MTPKELAERLRERFEVYLAELADGDMRAADDAKTSIAETVLDGNEVIIAALEAYDKKQWKHCGHDGFPKRGDEIVYGYYGKTGTWLWVAGVVDEHEDGFFVDFGEDGEDIKSDGYWMPVKPPTTERES